MTLVPAEKVILSERCGELAEPLLHGEAFLAKAESDIAIAAF